MTAPGSRCFDCGGGRRHHKLTAADCRTCPPGHGTHRQTVQRKGPLPGHHKMMPSAFPGSGETDGTRTVHQAIVSWTRSR